MADAFPIPTHHRFQDLTGMRFGRLTVSSYAGSRAKRTMWRCVCDCDRTTEVDRANLVRGLTESCGCFRDERTSARRAKHLKTRTPEWRCWHEMHRRCNDEKNPGYPYYGARGISVSPQWAEFSAFYEDMGPRPSPHHSIDRIDNDGNYEPGNCQWATKSEQAFNRRPKGSVRTS